MKYLMTVDHPLKENMRLRVQNYASQSLIKRFGSDFDVVASFDGTSIDTPVTFTLTTISPAVTGMVSTTLFEINRSELHPDNFNLDSFMNKYGHPTINQLISDIVKSAHENS